MACASAAPYDRAMAERGFALFETMIGRCGIAWGERGVVGIQLPEGRESDTRARLQRRFPDAREAALPSSVRRAVDSIVALLRGEKSDLSAIDLDMGQVPPFHRRVYEVARTIPPGTTLSYGEIAKLLGTPGSARAVGQALGKNPFAIVVPCHRVLAAGGRMGGFSANGGITTKRRLLTIEGGQPGGQIGLFDGDGAYGYDPAAAIEHLREVEPALARLIDAAGPFQLELKKAPSIFGALAEAIVYQQLTGKAAATIYARVCALFPRSHEGPTPQQVLRVSDEKLRGAGLSRPKLLALRDLARKAADGDIPTLAEVHRMEDAEIVSRLTAVRGIGRWTVEMLLIFRLGRPDVLPVDDYGVRKGFALTFKKPELPAPKDLEKRGERWKPYRSVASWYLWRAVELAKK
jgi:methylated-DNA-[protein]-cysteine S-methyltransferase